MVWYYKIALLGHLAFHDETHVPRKKPCSSFQKKKKYFLNNFVLIYESQEEESGRCEIMKKKKKMDRLAQKFVWTCEEGKGHSDTLFLSHSPVSSSERVISYIIIIIIIIFSNV